MIKHSLLLYVCLGMATHMQAEQFVYPVADFAHGNQLALIYQKSLQDIELWFLNTTTQTTVKGLSSFLTPANFRMLPSGQGFSFIDQGYIKIKEFNKRSPKTLQIYEPISLFSNMNWIDNQTFYFVALQGDCFQIFQGDIQGSIEQLTCKSGYHALYPQKINDTLFYIERSMNNSSSIVTIPYQPQSLATVENNNTPTTIIPATDNQIGFLSMLSGNQGFYVQIDQQASNHNTYQFAYHHITQEHNTWQDMQLFSFAIPAQYSTGADRLYESLEPFLPKYINNSIYFSSWNQQEQQFELYQYDLANQQVININHRCMHKHGQQLFAPYACHNKIYCGFLVRSIQNNQEDEISNRSIQFYDEPVFIPYIEE